MNREIKFRGQITKSYTGINLKNGDWIYGSLVDDRAYGGKIYISWWNKSCEINTITEINADTVGQYTGLKDMNGVEMFEGDIVDYKLGQTFIPLRDRCYNEIYYQEDHCGFFQRNIHKDGHRSLGFSITVSQDKIVVGNIHDNPELLKGGEQ